MLDQVRWYPTKMRSSLIWSRIVAVYVKHFNIRRIWLLKKPQTSHAALIHFQTVG
jgi:hypothetical protein